MPGPLFSIWFVSPCPMKPAPTMPTRMGLPCSWRALSALSTMIMLFLPWATASNGHPPLQLRLDLVERLPVTVLGGDLAHGQRPLESEPAIVEGQPALGGRRIELADVIAGFGAVLQHLVPVREPLGHVERAVVVGAQLDGDVLEIRRALGPQVDDDVEDRSAGRPHQLGLGSRRVLEVHPPDGALVAIEGDIGLGDHGLEPVLLELALAEDAREDPAVVLPPLEIEDIGAPQSGLSEDHRRTPLRPRPSA